MAARCNLLFLNDSKMRMNHVFAELYVFVNGITRLPDYAQRNHNKSWSVYQRVNADSDLGFLSFLNGIRQNKQYRNQQNKELYPETDVKQNPKQCIEKPCTFAQADFLPG